MNRFCSIFSQLLQLFPRWEFQQLVLETKAEAPCTRFQQLGTVCRHAVLPAGPCS